MCLREKKLLTFRLALYPFFLVFSVELTKKIDTLISLKMCSNPFVNNLNIL